METWLLWRQSIMAVFQITCEKLLGGEKEEWIFIKDHSSTYSYIHLFQIFNLCKKINGSKRETEVISALDQQQVSVGKDVKSWFFRICLDMKSWFSRAQEATLKKKRERERRHQFAVLSELSFLRCFFYDFCVWLALTLRDSASLRWLLSYSVQNTGCFWHFPSAAETSAKTCNEFWQSCIPIFTHLST